MRRSGFSRTVVGVLAALSIGAGPSGCGDAEEGPAQAEKVQSPEVAERKKDLKELDAEIEQVSAELALAGESARPKIQAHLDELKKKRRDVKRELKRLKGIIPVPEESDASGDEPGDAVEDVAPAADAGGD